MNFNHFFFCLFICLGIFSCSDHQKTFIVTGENEQVTEIGDELMSYLSRSYPSEQFLLSEEKISGERNIILLISDTIALENNEAFEVIGSPGQLIIQGKTPRAVRHGIYGLLKHLGWNFYLSFEVPPVEPKALDFKAIQIENAPLKDKRILFNWHNFLSGCTGWDLEDWQQWIDNGFKIGLNTVMVHAYGNNPMHTFSFNGEKKKLGYLTTTKKGRDWGSQHVNDVRLLHGGGLFTDDEFGSKAAKVPEEERALSATRLMQQVFGHAKSKNMDVCFALDVDTWMANPQNIINTLPPEALIKVGGYNTVNPEHPEGKRYYKAQLKQLFSDYPEIDMLAAWMRFPRENPRPAELWLKHYSSTLPGEWKQEYFEILKKHPELKDERPYPGLFAISKIIKVFREILDEINPDVELLLGSWRLYYPAQADVFMPESCSFIPLDWEVVFNQPEVVQELSAVGKNRKLYPVVWAHHDDHRYVGRPYIPFAGFNDLLDKSNAEGYGIIHWMTHPLDLLFNNYENQIWKKSENETWKKTITEFTESLLKEEEKNLHSYFQKWFTEAPMFGRETRDHFLQLDQDYQLEGYGSSKEAVNKARQRLAILQKVDPEKLNRQGMKEYRYQMGMEQFMISFFSNHHHGHTAYNAIQNGNMEEARESVKKLNPDETIEIYAETIKEYGATRGEEGILVSLNLRWLPDYIDLRQRTGMEAVRINFQPTSHDSLAQGAGNYTYFVDDDHNFWHSLGQKELNIPAHSEGNQSLLNINQSWLEISEEQEIPIESIRGHQLPAAAYELQLFFRKTGSDCQIMVLEDEEEITSLDAEKGQATPMLRFHSKGGDIALKINPGKEMTELTGLKIQQH